MSSTNLLSVELHFLFKTHLLVLQASSAMFHLSLRVCVYISKNETFVQASPINIGGRTAVVEIKRTTTRGKLYCTSTWLLLVS